MTEHAAPPSVLEQRVAAQRLRHVCDELRRKWLPILAADVVIAGLVGPHDAWVWALAWLLVVETAQTARRRVARRFSDEPPADARAALTRMVHLSGVIGLTRSSVIVLAYFVADDQTWMLLTMVMVGLAAGAVATAGGEVRITRWWSAPMLGALALGWIAKGNWTGGAIALLIVYLHGVLASYVSMLGQQGADLIGQALALERERDRVRAANAEITALANDLREQRDRVTAANEAKTRFLASASHDLRQPLYALSLNASLLSDIAASLDHAQLRRVEHGMRRALVQCRSLLDQLLDISKLEAGKVPLHWSAVDVTQLLLAMRPQYEAMAREKGLAWRLDLGREPVVVWSDASLLERLLGNLIHNAIKFTAEGEVGVRLVPGSGARAAVEVFDTGPGIPPDQQHRVFEDFYQVGNPSRDRTMGLGLGLSIVRRIAALLQAGVALHSPPGEGARFVVDMPVAPAQPPASAPAPLMDTPSYDAGRSLTVLVIDDEPDILDDLSALLTARGWQVRTAAGVEQARDEARNGLRPDVVLADYRLQFEHTGLEAIEAVREIVGPVPALIVTGDTAPQRIVEANAAGYPVLHKPLDGHTLERALREAAAGGVAASPLPS